ncbi:unnamed protein product [Protopolystoma xenopodis]|uniref:Uncharacterized protein n=1 Tax=Protopolystoma xenopodis TaxID=117903 RepID=A0A3S5A1F1_9PLAT|nr:unnamed protein product [Protopolystoma xenopodis]
MKESRVRRLQLSQSSVSHPSPSLGGFGVGCVGPVASSLQGTSNFTDDASANTRLLTSGATGALINGLEDDFHGMSYSSFCLRFPC